MEVSDSGLSWLPALWQQPTDVSSVPATPTAVPNNGLPPPSDSVVVSDEAKILQQALVPLVESILQPAGTQSTLVDELLGNSANPSDIASMLTSDGALATFLPSSQPTSSSPSTDDPLTQALIAGTTNDASLLDMLDQTAGQQPDPASILGGL